MNAKLDKMTKSAKSQRRKPALRPKGIPLSERSEKKGARASKKKYLSGVHTAMDRSGSG